MTDSFPAPSTITIGKAVVPVSDLRLVVAESGLSLAGGELLIWKRNLVVTATRRYAVNGLPVENAARFEEWLRRAPHAVGIRLDGSIKLPTIAPDSIEDPLQILSDALSAVKHELRRQMVKTTALAGVLGVGGIVQIAVIVVYNVNHPKHLGGFMTGIYGFILVVASMLFGARVIMLLARRRRIIAVLAPLAARGELPPEGLAAAVGPTRVYVPTLEGEAGPTDARARVIPATLAILGLVCACCPFVGVILSAIALGLTFREKTWVRTVAIIGLVLGILSGTFATIMILQGPK